jgi:hypothetical protein
VNTSQEDYHEKRPPLDDGSDSDLDDDADDEEYFDDVEVDPAITIEEVDFVLEQREVRQR